MPFQLLLGTGSQLLQPEARDSAAGSAEPTLQCEFITKAYSPLGQAGGKAVMKAIYIPVWHQGAITFEATPIVDSIEYTQCRQVFGAPGRSAFGVTDFILPISYIDASIGVGLGIQGSHIQLRVVVDAPTARAYFGACRLLYAPITLARGRKEGE